MSKCANAKGPSCVCVCARAHMCVTVSCRCHLRGPHCLSGKYQTGALCGLQLELLISLFVAT